jgi:hypothetical protein
VVTGAGTPPIGGYRMAERGTLRGYQFDKVEMFQIGIGRAAAVVKPPGADPIVLLNPRIAAASDEMDDKIRRTGPGSQAPADHRRHHGLLGDRDGQAGAIANQAHLRKHHRNTEPHEAPYASCAPAQPISRQAAPERSGAASSSHGSARRSRQDGHRRGLAVSLAITQLSRTGRTLPNQEALTCDFVPALEWLDAPGRSLQPVPCGTQ